MANYAIQNIINHSGKKIVIDGESFEYSLSEDKNNLVLKGKETLNLTRSGF
jgi:hypothetical protein